MSDWVCYLLRSLDNNHTYIGATNDSERRLNAHNSMSKGRKGAKRTCGQTWVHVLIVSGFRDKRSCLSFEAGWKRLAKSRSNKKLAFISLLSGEEYKYTRDTIMNRILDLLYFVHHTSFIGTKFMINHDYRVPVLLPDYLALNTYIDINTFPWPYFAVVKLIK